MSQCQVNPGVESSKSIFFGVEGLGVWVGEKQGLRPSADFVCNKKGPASIALAGPI
jgi:hypothetical protein